MKRYQTVVILSGLALLSGCGGDGDKKERAKLDAQVTETRMDDIDKIEGTINDDMINVDDQTQAAPLAKDDKKNSSNTDEAQ